MIKNEDFKNVIACLRWHIDEARSCTESPSNIERLELVTRAFGALSGNYHEYKDVLDDSTQFLEELELFIHDFNEHIVQEREKLLDESFQLLESFAAVMKEASLKNLDKQKTHEELCTYFEKSGDWQADGETLVEDIYFRVLPGKAQI